MKQVFSSVIVRTAVVLGMVLLFSVSFAPHADAALNGSQIQAILNVLVAFHVDESTVEKVDEALNGQVVSTQTISTSTAAYSFTRTLSVGEQGPDVSELQQYLKDNGFYTYPTVTGYYGPITAGAVEAFQRAHGIEAIGIFGPETRAFLNNLLARNSSSPAAPATGNAPSTNASTNGGSPSVSSSSGTVLPGEGGGSSSIGTSNSGGASSGSSSGGTASPGRGGSSSSVNANGSGSPSGGSSGGASSSPIPTAALTASLTSITSGQSSTLSWSSTNAASCAGTGFTASGTSGTVSVSPAESTTYSIVCTGSGGSSLPAGVSVTVTPNNQSSSSGSSGGTSTSSATIQSPGPSQALFGSPYYKCSTNYYVSTTGSDSSGDGSLSSPWSTLQHANDSLPGNGAAAGTCINVEPGTYPAGVTITNGGNLASATGYVVYRCTVMDACKITASGFATDAFGIESTNWSGPDYIMIDGFDLAAASSDTYGIGVTETDPTNPGGGNTATTHHLWVLNSIIHGYGQAGINPTGTDFQYYLHNDIYDNSGNTCDAQGSGISIVVPKAFPNYTPTADDKVNPDPLIGSLVVGSGFFHNVVEWNVVHNNGLTNCGTASNAYDTDGNGIILDTFDTRSDGSGNSVDYPYPSLVAFNVSYDNGGGGVHLFEVQHATVANNTVYNNYLDPGNGGSARGNMDESDGGDDTFINNISVAIPAAHSSCQYSTPPYAMWNSAFLISPESGLPADTFSRNVTDLMGGNLGCNNEIGLFSGGQYSATNNKESTNPLWVDVGNTSTGTITTPPIGSNFALQEGSPAVSYGLTEPYLPAQSIDLGACYHTLTNCGVTNTGGSGTVAPPPSPTASLSVSPASITSGQSASVAWSSTDATSCTGTGFSTNSAASGSVSVSPTSSVTYSISCTGAGGTSPIKSVEVTVNYSNAASKGLTTLYLTSGATWTVPSDWNSSNNTIEAIGGGGGGGAGNAGNSTGGGGGAYSKITDLALTPGAAITYAVGTGGSGATSPGGNGGDSYFNGSSCSASSLCAKGGAGGQDNGNVDSGSYGGQASAGVGTIKYSGGNGGSNNSGPGGSGGGAAGPQGNGGAGAGNSSGSGGNGGGGADGGSTGVAATNAAGGAGGNNSLGTGGGAGGTSLSGNGSAGINGGGGGGNDSAVSNSTAGAGGNGTEWDSSHGAGGGGGNSTNSAGSNGGLYGGGGGSASWTTSGNGAPGIIVITYTPSNS